MSCSPSIAIAWHEVQRRLTRNAHGEIVNQTIQSFASLASSLMILAALFVLLRQRQSVWLIVAIVAELAGLAFRGVLAMSPDIARTMPMLFSVWTLCALVFAGGLLAYAIETTQKR
jgi:hypothetical protein